jgi:hypothetical protein
MSLGTERTEEKSGRGLARVLSATGTRLAGVTGRAEDSSSQVVSSSKLPALFRAHGSIGLARLAVSRVRVVGEACDGPGPVGAGASRLSVAATLLAPSPSREPGFLLLSVRTHENATASCGVRRVRPVRASSVQWHLICKKGSPHGRSRPCAATANARAVQSNSASRT